MSVANDSEFGRFLEIEHKFVVAPDFDVEEFSNQVEALRPERITDVRQVKDTYYVSKTYPEYIFRHRYDGELQHLTAKQAKTAYTSAKNAKKSDNEVREEINILLSQEKGDQDQTVRIFLQTLGVKPIGCLYKDIRVFYFADCEVCLYKASQKNNQKPEVRCVEFEAKHYHSEAEGLQILFRYEKKLGFDATKREKRNLFDIFFSDSLAT